MTTGHQASAHAEPTDCAVALHIDLWRFDAVFIEARLERRQIEAVILGAESLFQGQRSQSRRNSRRHARRTRT